jgi:predicted RNase H-like HicB family nuclease
MTTAEHLKKPYPRRLVPDEAGGYVASIQEFPGCVAEGNTAEEALANLEAAAASWIEAALASGQQIPEPIDLHGYSGKVVLRMPRGLHKRAAEMAATEATSLNQLLVTAIASHLGKREAYSTTGTQIGPLWPTVFFSNPQASFSILNVEALHASVHYNSAEQMIVTGADVRSIPHLLGLKRTSESRHG